MDHIFIVAGAIICAVIGGGALLSVRLNKQKRRTDVNKVTIRDVSTSGDVAGRDINKLK